MTIEEKEKQWEKFKEKYPGTARIVDGMGMREFFLYSSGNLKNGKHLFVIHAIHELLPLANVNENESTQVLKMLNQLNVNFDYNLAFDICHILFKRKRKSNVA
jgi:KaiC/GvpD/RAD55 family RecA-like ATPase